MCGVCGFIKASSLVESDRETLGRMVRTLAHRGPDDSGLWLDPKRSVALGHTRLAIIDLSPDGRQPMFSSCGRYVVVFNGEVYNFLAVREELEEKGHRFRGHSDTEVMLAAFTEWGVEKAVAHFNGMFSFCVWDDREGLLKLVRDRLGEKPLYYGWLRNTFVFASELKALLAHPDSPREIDRRALALYLKYQYIPAPHSIFRGIYKLMPGSILTVDPKRPGKLDSLRTYWSIQEQAERGIIDEISASAEEVVSQLEALLQDSIRLRMYADVPVGVCPPHRINCL